MIVWAQDIRHFVGVAGGGSGAGGTPGDGYEGTYLQQHQAQLSLQQQSQLQHLQQLHHYQQQQFLQYQQQVCSAHFNKMTYISLKCKEPQKQIRTHKKNPGVMGQFKQNLIAWFYCFYF